MTEPLFIFNHYHVVRQFHYLGILIKFDDKKITCLDEEPPEGAQQLSPKGARSGQMGPFVKEGS